MQQIFILLIVIAAGWIRLWRLNEIPPGLWYDEAYNAMDAIWMLATKSPQIFFPANYGREPMFHYMAAIFMLAFGYSHYIFRLLPALVGTITIPLMYRWVKSFFYDVPHRQWLALFSATGLAFSFWHISMSRSGFRTVLFPLFVILTSYWFWLGWQRRSPKYYIWAGIALGLSQYTYLAARLLPFVYGLFIVIWSLVGLLFPKNRQDSLRQIWFWLLIMAIVSFLVFIPLGLFFLNNPGSLVARTGDVSIWNEVALGKVTFTDHMIEAFRVFINGSHLGWRHDLVDHSTFGWLAVLGFWVGLLLTVRRFMRPQNLFLLIGLVVLWLPGLLSRPPVHSLRLSGLLPFYYIFVAIGLFTLTNLVGKVFPRRDISKIALFAVFILFAVFSFGFTTYNYFVLWANKPMVYAEFEGPQTDLTRYLLELSKEKDILLPFNFYQHPATRFLLYKEFREETMPPDSALHRPGIVVDNLTRDNSILVLRGNSPAYVWLTRDDDGQGSAFVSRQPWLADSLLQQTSGAVPFKERYSGDTVAMLTSVEDAALYLPLFQDRSSFRQLLNYSWLNKFQLLGYHLTPDPVQPGQTLDLNLYWQTLQNDISWDYDVAVTVYNNQGRFVSQSEFSAKELFSWRSVGAETVSQHLFYMGPELPAGPYIMRLSILHGDEIIPREANNSLDAEEVTLGLFYVADNDLDPRHFPVPVNALLNGHIKLLGYAPPAPLGNNLFRGKLYWQTQERVLENFTPFVYLINSQHQIISRWEAPPLAGQYPTSYWSPEEIVVDEYDVILPEQLPSGDYRLMAGMIDPATDQLVLAVDGEAQPFLENMVLLEHINIP